MSNKTKIFISYSHKNEKHFIALMTHLNAIAKYNNLDIFTDQNIAIGETLDKSIQDKLKDAHMVICIVSTEYLNSDYCVRKELEIAIEKQTIDNTKIFPIIAEESMWKRTYFGQLKCAPKDGIPVSKYEDIGLVYLTIVDQIMNQIEKNRELETEKKNDSLTPALFSQSEKFHKYVNDLGINVKHPQKDILLLNDIFIYPDMEHLNSNSTIKYKQISSDQVIKKFDYTYFIGSDKSGKTALLKKYCNDLIELGYQVVTLKADDIKHFSAEQLLKTCSNKFSINYDNSKSNFVLLIDDFHRLRISEKYESNFLESITNFFKKIYFFVDKQHFFGDSLKHLNIKFEIFEIKNLGHVKRNELYSKWYSIGVESPYTQNDSEFLKKIDNLTNHFDLLLRKNVMDAKPMYILTIIQTLDNINLSRDFSLTSYGHCYNTLILSLLQKTGVNHNDFDSILNFLSFLAYEMFIKKIKNISEDDFDLLLSRYHLEYVISPNIKNILIEANIIYLDDNLYLIFSQKYIYYFSCSKYIAMNQNNLSDLVKELCENIHTEESANILIFLVHHSNSTDFLDYILEYSSNLLENYQPHYLTIDQNTDLNNKFRKILFNEITQIRLEHKNVYDERNKKLTLRDQIEEPDTIIDSAINSFEESKEELKEELEQNLELKQINDSNTIFRCLEVLGQIAKNKHGSFNRVRLENLLNSSYELGLKSLSFFLDVLMKSDNDLKEFIVSIIKEKNKTSEEEALSISEKMIFEMCRSVCRYLITFIAKATASPQLDQIVNELLLKKNNPAYQLIFIQTQLQLGRIPKKEIKTLYELENHNNMIVTTLLQNMVLNYIYMNKIDFAEKKWISSVLQIPMNNQYNKMPENSLIRTIL